MNFIQTYWLHLSVIVAGILLMSSPLIVCFFISLRLNKVDESILRNYHKKPRFSKMLCLLGTVMVVSPIFKSIIPVAETVAYAAVGIATFATGAIWELSIGYRIAATVKTDPLRKLGFLYFHVCAVFFTIIAASLCVFALALVYGIGPYPSL